MADENSIEQRVSEIIVNQLNVNEEQITPGASFLDDLGADSLDTVELIMAFEEEFKDEIQGEIPESDAATTQHLIHLTERYNFATLIDLMNQVISQNLAD